MSCSTHPAMRACVVCAGILHVHRMPSVSEAGPKSQRQHRRRSVSGLKSHRHQLTARLAPCSLRCSFCFGGWAEEQAPTSTSFGVGAEEPSPPADCTACSLRFSFSPHTRNYTPLFPSRNIRVEVECLRSDVARVHLHRCQQPHGIDIVVSHCARVLRGCWQR